jgi:hypothetical protein
MRVVSAALSASLVALGLMLSSPLRRTWLALGAMVALTPMAGHLAGSVNPSSMEISAALGLGIGLMGFDGFEGRNRPRLLWALSLLVFAVAWSRPFATFTLLAVLGASVLMNWDSLRSWGRSKTAATIGLGAIAAAVTSAGAFQALFRHPTPALIGPSAEVESPWNWEFLGTQGTLGEIEHAFIRWTTDLVGLFGWVDHRPPPLVSILWIGLVLSLLVLAVAYGRRRDRIALTLVAAGALIVTPLFVAMKFVSARIYQARYHLPVAVLIVIAVIIVFARLERGGSQIKTWRLLRGSSTLVPIAMLVSIAASLHRYSVGDQAQMADVLRLPFVSHAWLPPWGALLVAGIAAGVMTIATAAVWRASHQCLSDLEVNG